jgi:hypothetical protein
MPRKPRKPKAVMQEVNLTAIPVQAPPEGDALSRILNRHVAQMMEQCQFDAVQIVASRVLPGTGGDAMISTAGQGNIMTRRAIAEAFLEGPPPVGEDEETPEF